MKPSNRRIGPGSYPGLDMPEDALAGCGSAADRAQAEELRRRAKAVRAARLARVWAGVRVVCGVALVAGASLGVAWGARWYVTRSPRFALTSVRVAGTDRRPSDAIAAESGLTLGANVFSCDLDAARGRILADPWIADASLARRLPGAIQVRVVERKAAALVALGDTFLASADGEPFKRLEAGDPVDYPLVTGLSPERFAEDREDARGVVRRAIELAAEYERSPLARRAPLEEVHVEAPAGFSLVVGRSAVRIVFGGPPFRRKLDEAARVVAELDRRRMKAQAIMLDNEARPERVVVRLR